ncbi:prolipoprotein diacylglyceryl transferase [Aliiroseovarius sp. F47248L]|uniref:prolipoprotein diacylglyceryl transferase n=1 Tax=Aliiroseovarius sp. F47248L TaxID=2926420 RepID=UPI001FF53C97|nr:prolipoprotein diacylglyceryl transferase [Aliiroseovarius sp. F47248L]MCK0137820.1 prolipoprotein diacylglyceryl transferase [Aliiroseovarius sp. F47248L]
MFLAIPFPAISPEIFSVEIGSFTFALRWYALGYLAGIALGWWIIARAISKPALWRGDVPMTRSHLEDLATWAIVGIVLGGRLGYVLFYDPAHFLQNPLDIPKVWTGGMSFHGGFLGIITVTCLFARKHGIAVAKLADLMAIAAPIGIGLVRITNFINAELWGRPTSAPWGVIFPGEAAQSCPGWDVTLGACARHPSQLYEAILEGLLLAAILLTLAFRRGWLKRPGMLTGLFFLGYGLSRFIVEFFRQADMQFITSDNPWGHVIRLGDWGLTMGQTLTLPMIVIGIFTMIWAARQTSSAASP